MELLSLQDYKTRVDEFYQKHDEYLHELSAINVAENKYCNTLTKEQEDIYFEEDENGALINEIARGYEEQREALKEIYKGFDDYYGTNYGTILTDEAIELFKYGDTSKRILEKAKEHAGQQFVDSGTVYNFLYVLITPDDFYWVGQSDEGRMMYYTCVGSPHWIEK